MTRHGILIVSALAGVTVLYLALLLFGPTEALVRTPEYQLPVIRHGLWSRVPAGALVLGLGLFAIFSLAGKVEELTATRAGRLRLWVALFLAGVACQVGPSAVHRYGLVELPLRVYLPDHTSYFTDAARIDDLRPWLRNFNSRLSSFATHTRTHPPGAVLLFYFPLQVMRASPELSQIIFGRIPRGDTALGMFSIGPPEAAAGFVMSLFLLAAAAAAVPLAFALVRVFLDDRRALAASALFAAMPGFAQKTPALDHLLGVILLASGWLMVTALRDRKMRRVAVAGALVGAGLWIGTSLLAAPLFCLLMLGAGIHRFRKPEARPKTHLGLFLSLTAIFFGSAGAALVLVGAVLDLNAFDTYQAITEAGWRFNNEISGRTHAWMWVAWDPYELLIFSGLPAGALAVASWGREAAAVGRRQWDRAQPWLWAIWVFLAALALSGKVVYEASRLAWFAFPLTAAAAAAALPDEMKTGRTTAVAIVALTAVSALVFRLLF